jgi:hypothetical protein
MAPPLGSWKKPSRVRHRLLESMLLKRNLITVAVLCGCWCAAHAESPLETGWSNPPRDARLRAYWWWPNGNVTREAISRDLEEMKAKGFGGALICDADGSSQDGNDRAPHGPDFFSPEWRALFKHTLREADRLGLEMSLNIQSGWNLGGPMVAPEDAPKKLVWTEMRVQGGTRFAGKLEPPKSRDGFYRDLFVLAFPVNPAAQPQPARPTLTASSAQPEHAARAAGDGDINTFWVSGGTEPGQGPSSDRPQWLQLGFSEPFAAEGLSLVPRNTYGPRDCDLQVSDDGKTFRTVKAFTAAESGETTISFPPVNTRFFRLVIKASFDPRHPQSPRNVQVTELRLTGEGGSAVPPATSRQPLQNQAQKALLSPLRPFSAPDSTPLFQEFPATVGEQDTLASQVLDLTARLERDGTLRWEAPAGEWQVIRLGFTLNDHCRVSTCSQGWDGYALDPFDAGAFRRYWDAVVEPLIADAGPLAGKALKYLHTDSWEVEVASWTPTLRDEFRSRRGYDLLPWLPVITGRIVNSREESNRFLHDIRRTMGDLAIANHYRLFKEGAHKHGLLIHPESGGPHAVPIDAQQCLGFDDAPMSEFWAWSWRHRVGDENRFFVKQPASAAHTYGHKLVLAEGFTTIGPHWQETLWDNLKPSFDHACTEGLNLLVWHAFVCSPASEGIPGQQYFAGTHLNPNVTWWEKSAPFFSYINRCQWLLQQGLSAADVAYYYGDHVPNFAQLRRSDPARVGPGYDYDVVTEEVILNRMIVKDGRLVLPEGVSYRLLVLPNRTVISLSVLRKLKEFVAAGATVLGPRPTSASGLKGYPASDAEVKRLADELWGRGGVRAGQTAHEVLLGKGVRPDFEWAAQGGPQPEIDFIHRTAAGAEIYFVANRSTNGAMLSCSFRVAEKAPELWDAVSGEHRFATAYTQAEGRTTLPLELGPCGSRFVVFREPAAKHAPSSKRNDPEFRTLGELSGPWAVSFDPKWGGPESAPFDRLVSWTTRSEPSIKFYSGTAVYRKTFDAPANLTRTSVCLDLGDLRELAEVRINGKSCGITWSPPFRVGIRHALKPGANQLEIEVVNFWPNRIIGDALLPKDQRLTRTNIRKLTPETPLMKSGLFGPVRFLERRNPDGLRPRVNTSL